MIKNLKFCFALFMTATQVCFLCGPLVLWIYTGEKHLWYRWEHERVFAAWFFGGMIALFSWMPYSFHD